MKQACCLPVAHGKHFCLERVDEQAVSTQAKQVRVSKLRPLNGILKSKRVGDTPENELDFLSTLELVP